jgi:hypothetical protein
MAKFLCFLIIIQWRWHLNYESHYLKNKNVSKRTEIKLNQEILSLNTFKNVNHQMEQYFLQFVVEIIAKDSISQVKRLELLF